MRVKVAQSCLWLFPTPWTHGILQARILECVAVPFSRGSSQPRDWTQVSCIASEATREVVAWPVEPQGEAHQLNRGNGIGLDQNYLFRFFQNILLKNPSELVGQPSIESESEVVKLCPTLWDPMEYSRPGSSVHGIFQARKLEWVAISLSRGSSRPRGQTWVSHIVGRRFTVWVTREAHFLEFKGRNMGCCY